MLKVLGYALVGLAGYGIYSQTKAGVPIVSALMRPMTLIEGAVGGYLLLK